MDISFGNRRVRMTEDQIAEMLLNSDSEDEISPNLASDSNDDIFIFDQVTISRVGDKKIQKNEEDAQIGLEPPDYDVDLLEPAEDNIFSLEVNNMPIIFEEDLENPVVESEIVVSNLNDHEIFVEEINDQVQENASNVDKESSLQWQITNKKDIVWKRDKFESTSFLFESENVNEHVNAVVEDPLQYFYKYVPRTLFESISDNTNLYAEQKSVPGWKNTNAEEIEILFGLHIAMGHLKLPQSKMYWSNDIDLKMFTDNMNLKRFYSLRNNLHIVDNLTKPADCHDRLFKVRPLLDSILSRCLSLPREKTLSVDEQMIPFRGKFNIKQYIRGSLHFALHY